MQEVEISISIPEGFKLPYQVLMFRLKDENGVFYGDSFMNFIKVEQACPSKLQLRKLQPENSNQQRDTEDFT